MIKEAIEKIQALVTASMEPQEFVIGEKRIVSHNGKTYNDEPSLPEPLMFTTLSGLADYVNGKFDARFINGNPIIHVKTPTQVEFIDEARAPYAKRNLLAGVKPQLPETFPFGQFMSCEEFMIRIQARFLRDVGDWENVVESCVGIKKQEGLEYKDSGVVQTVATQSGLSLSSMKKIPNPVILAPFRTFPEVTQPESAFILRATDGRNGPELALFEADGGAWRIDATASIKVWLEQKIPGYTVIS